MARGLEKAIYTLRAMSSAREGVVCVADPRRSVLVCLVYLVVMLSVPVRSLQTLLFFAIYPIVASAMAGIGYWTVFSRSLIVLPFVLLIGIFNPLYHTDTGIAFGSVTVSEGWLEFVSILLRAMLSVQAVLILIADCGFTGICRSLGRLGTPAFLTTQLLMVYRYLCVLLQEAQNMRRARDARGYGRRDMSLKMWGEFTGQLFIRAVDRSQRIHRAMLARGFDGTMPTLAETDSRWTAADTAWLAGWTAAFLIFRLVNIPALLHFA